MLHTTFTKKDHIRAHKKDSSHTKYVLKTTDLNQKSITMISRKALIFWKQNRLFKKIHESKKRETTKYSELNKNEDMSKFVTPR